MEWHDICMISKKDAHILCVHLNCPMVPMQSSTKAVLLIGKTDVNLSEEAALDHAITNYGDVPIVVVNDSGQQLWHALCQEERLNGRIFAQSQMNAGKTEGILLILHVLNHIGIVCILGYSVIAQYEIFEDTYRDGRPNTHSKM